MINAKHWLGKGWIPNPTEPSYLANAPLSLFDFQDGNGVCDVHDMALGTGQEQWIQQTSLEQATKDIAARLQVSGRYAAFSAAVSTQVERNEVRQKKQMVALYQKRFRQGKVIFDLPFSSHGSRLKQSIKDEMMSLTPQQIVAQMGHFYAYSITVGGIIQAEFKQVQEYHDTYTAFQTNVSGRYKGLTMSVAAEGGTGIRAGTTTSNEKLQVNVLVAGGEPTLMKSAQGSTSLFDSRGPLWENSIQNGVEPHLYPIDFELRPIWDLVATVDQGKANAVRAHLESVWDQNLDHLKALDGYHPIPAWTGQVVLQQGDPGRNEGSYDCRERTVDACESMRNQAGCWEVDDFFCDDPGMNGMKPFKWGSHAYFGQFLLPPGLCVTTYRNWGRCIQGKEIEIEKCCPSGSSGPCTEYVWDLHDHNQRVCSFRFNLQQGLKCEWMS